MAKGDAVGGAASGASKMGMGAPKMDQYSVMHKIFDHLGGQQNNAIAPMQNQMSAMGMQNTYKPNFGLPNAGNMSGNYGGLAPSVGPGLDLGGGRIIGSGPRSQWDGSGFQGFQQADPNYKQDSNMANGLAPNLDDIMQQLFQGGPVRRMM